MASSATAGGQLARQRQAATDPGHHDQEDPGDQHTQRAPPGRQPCHPHRRAAHFVVALGERSDRRVLGAQAFEHPQPDDGVTGDRCRLHDAFLLAMGAALQRPPQRRHRQQQWRQPGQHDPAEQRGRDEQDRRDGEEADHRPGSAAAQVGDPGDPGRVGGGAADQVPGRHSLHAPARVEGSAADQLLHDQFRGIPQPPGDPVPARRGGGLCHPDSHQHGQPSDEPCNPSTRCRTPHRSPLRDTARRARTGAPTRPSRCRRTGPHRRIGFVAPDHQLHGPKSARAGGRRHARGRVVGPGVTAGCPGRSLHRQVPGTRQQTRTPRWQAPELASGRRSGTFRASMLSQHLSPSRPPAPSLRVEQNPFEIVEDLVLGLQTPACESVRGVDLVCLTRLHDIERVPQRVRRDRSGGLAGLVQGGRRRPDEIEQQVCVEAG